MADKDKGLLFFYDWVEPFRELSGDDFKALVLAMIDYKHGIEPPEFSGAAKIVSCFVFPQLSRSMAASEAGKAGGKASVASRGASSTASSNASSESQPQDKTRQDETNTMQNDAIPNDTVVKGKTANRFIPPTLEEVQSYCSERKNGIDAQHFIDFYATRGWMIGKNKMRDWKACIRTWEQRDKKQKKPDPFDDDYYSYKGDSL